MPHYRRLVGEKCYLSPLTMEDSEQWAAWDNDLEVTLPLGDEVFIPISLEKERDAVAGAIRAQGHVFSIVSLEEDALIGRCMLFELSSVDRTALLGIVIGEKSCWNQGYGTDALRLLLDFGFNLLNLNNIMLTTFAFNARAQRCYEKLGFKVIGRRRQGRIIAGKTYDVVMMDMLAEDFKGGEVRRVMDAQGG